MTAMARIALSNTLLVLAGVAMGGCTDGRAADPGTIETRVFASSADMDSNSANQTIVRVPSSLSSIRSSSM
jgi:hypothetical protein